MRIAFGLGAATIAGYAAWLVGQVVERLVLGVWAWVPQIYFYVPCIILLIVILLGSPTALILRRFADKFWAYVLGGSFCALVFPILFYVLMGFVFYGQCVDHYDEECPPAWKFVMGSVVGALTRIDIGLYAALVGGFAGLAFWATRRLRRKNAELVHHL